MNCIKGLIVSDFAQISRRQIGRAVSCLGLLMLAVMWLMQPTSYVSAQAANFVSYQRTLPIAGLTGITSVAVDANGNFYIVDNNAGKVYKTAALASGAFSPVTTVATIPFIYGVAVDSNGVVYVSSNGSNDVYSITPNGSGGYNAPVVIGTFSDPTGLAVDSSFNVYVADPVAGQVYKLTPGSLPYAVSNVGSGWSQPAGVAVDSYGDVYVSDFHSSYIIEEQLSGGVYTPVNLGNGDFGEPAGVSVDYQGNVYVSDNANQTAYKLQPTNGGSYVETTTAIYLSQPLNTAVDQLGNFYIADYGQQAVIELSNNFGTLGVGSTNSFNNKVEANFIFTATATVGGTLVETNGNANGDYFAELAPASNCNAGTTYTPGQLCAVMVGFKAQAPGERLGSVALTDAFGNVISTAGNFSGFGVAPRAGLLPGTWNKVAGGIAQTNFANAITLDGSNYIYTVASNNVYMTTDFGGTWTQVFNGTTDHATGAVVDGSGNVFVSTVDGYVYECVPVLGSYVQFVVVDEGFTIQSITIDANGDLFLVDSPLQQLEEAIPSGGGSYSLNTIFNFAFFDFNSEPAGVAVDASGNIFVVDYYMGAVYAGLPQSYGGYYFYEVVRGLDTPVNVIVDPADNLYITDAGLDTGAPTLYQALIPNLYSGVTSYKLFPIATTIASYPLDGLATDSSGNFYVTDDDANGNIFQINLSEENLNFASSALGVVSADSPQTVWMANTGNQTLSISVPGGGQNPSISNNFLLGSGGTEVYPGYATPIPDCPVIFHGGAAGSLNYDSVCSLPISFEPTVSGPITGQAVITDNSMYANSHQIVTLNGIGLVEGTTTTVSSSLNPSNYGVQVTLTALVKETSGTETPTGTVQFVMNGTNLGGPITLVSGVAEYTSNLLPAGTDHIYAVYTPNSTNFATSTSATLNQIVNADVPAITLTSSVNPSFTGQSVTFTVNVAQAFGTVIPSGTIQFTSNGINIGTPISLVDGQATYTTSTLPSGNDTIVANFTSNNTSINSGSASLVQVVNINIPVIALTSSVNPSVAGQLVTFNVVLQQNVGVLIPTGTIQFTVNGVALGGPITLVNGTATVSSSNLPNGSDTIVAAYTSNSVNFANGSASLVQVVNINVPVIGLSSSLNPSNYGQDVTLAVSIGQAPGAPVPSGTVQFEMNGNALGTPYTLVNGGASMTLNNLPAGSDVITAVFTSANQYYASGTATLTQVVNIDTPTITLTSSLNPSTYGQPVTFNAVIGQSAGSIQPVGSVQFFGNNGSGNVPLTTPLLLVNGIASFSTNALSAGTWQISVVYTSTSPNFVSGSASLTQVVNKVTPIVSLSTSANPIFVTNPITLVGSVSGYATDIGTMTFYDGTTMLWTGSAGVNGVELQLPNLAVGAHSLFVSYSGNANVSAGSSTIITENVEDFTIAIATAPTKPIMSGGTATYTFTFTPVGPLTTMPADINLDLTGAPPDSTITLTPSPVTNGSGTTTVTFLLKVSAGLVDAHPKQRPGSRIPVPMLLALLLMPFAAKMRKAGKRLTRLIALVLLSAACATTIVGLAGCGQQLIPEWIMTLTATSGTLQHSVDVKISVE